MTDMEQDLADALIEGMKASTRKMLERVRDSLQDAKGPSPTCLCAWYESCELCRLNNPSRMRHFSDVQVMNYGTLFTLEKQSSGTQCEPPAPMLIIDQGAACGFCE